MQTRSISEAFGLLLFRRFAPPSPQGEGFECLRPTGGFLLLHDPRLPKNRPRMVHPGAIPFYSTVTLFARFLGLSISQPRWRAM